MVRPSIIDPKAIYAFDQYFSLNFDSEDIFRELGCSFDVDALTLPKIANLIPFSDKLSKRLESSLNLTGLTNGRARREILIAPILSEICRYTNQPLKIEYPIKASRLEGCLDYFIPSSQNLVVVAAKDADMARGFNKLGASLVALDTWTQQASPILYGVVTTGDIWQFGQFIRAERKILKDIYVHTVPTGLESLLSILLGIIQPVPIAA